MKGDPVIVLRRIFDAAVAAAQPEAMMADLQLPLDRGRTFVLAAGKAAPGMARYAHDALRILRGLTIAPVRSPEGPYPLIQSAHPEPDENSLRAGEAALAQASALQEGDTLLMLISGGASALMESLPPGVTLDELRALNRGLLRSGLSIRCINAVRRRVSMLKGGRLAAIAWPAQTITLALSDVPGDGLADVGSGPTIASDDAPTAAEDVLMRAGVETPPSIASWLRDPRSRPPPANDERLARTSAQLVGSPRRSLDAAATCARAAGFEVVVLGDALEGDARELGAAHSLLALEAAHRGAPTAILSGGETTVHVRSGGRGGRNKTYLASAALHCAGHPRIWGLAADTDGVDGTQEDAGAWFGPHTLAQAQVAGVSAAHALETCDTYGLFETADSLIVTGPTGTNVNDLRVLLIV